MRSHSKPNRPSIDIDTDLIVRASEAKNNEEEQEFMLQQRPLMKPYKYLRNPNGVATSVKRRAEGDLITRTLVGTQQDYKQVEASRFLAKLNGITMLKQLN